MFRSAICNVRLYCRGGCVFMFLFVASDLLAQDPAPLTPAQLADQIERQAERFQSVEYEATFESTRNSRAFQGEPLLVEGDGSFLFRSDGNRVYARERGFSINFGSVEKFRTDEIVGFDGDVDFHSDNRGVAIGETDGLTTTLDPRELFWQAGLSRQWLLSALRRPEARVTAVRTVTPEQAGPESPVTGSGNGTVTGPITEPVTGQMIDVVSEWTPDWSQQAYRFEISIAPDLSFLPVRVRSLLDGKFNAEWTIERIRHTPSGLAYPAVFENRRPETDSKPKHRIQITRFVERTEFDAADFAIPVRSGHDVVDYRLGFGWHDDPWWSELSPWLRETLDWPPLDESNVSELVSYCEPELAGQAAPNLDVAEWLTPALRGAEASGWRRPGRKVTLIYFFGGQAISPTPRQLTALRSLWEKFNGSLKNIPLDEQGEPVLRPGAVLDGGRVDVIAIATAHDKPELTRRLIASLKLPFPVAIDAASESKEATGARWGRTFAAFRQKAYTGLVLIGQDEKVIVLDRQSRASGGRLSGLEQIIRSELTTAGVSADPLSTRWNVARRVSRLLRAEPATRDDFVAVGQDAADGWRDRLEQRLVDSLTQAERERIVAGRLTIEDSLNGLHNEPLRLQTREIRLIESEWKRRMAALPGQSRLHGVVRSKFSLSGTQPVPRDAEAGLAGATLELVPTMTMLSSPTLGGYFQFRDEQRRKTVLSGPNGEFSFPGLTKGAWRLTLTAPGLVSTQRTIEIAEDGDIADVELALNQLDSVRGRVIDADGKPVAQAIVRGRKRHLNPANRASYTTDKLPTAPSRTDQDGRFAFDGLFEGHYTFAVDAEGFETATVEFVECGTQNVEVVLTRSQ